ncbi:MULTISPECIES: endonuclease/exonuclease/phosphatase family protein [Sphingopyxis]|uniref:endonuclease/exonuclease/phosphatase family protein n=1 Tax=Sphingopyxis TaxID=165697 RepID=UPI00131A3641|nr:MULTISPECIES: endonuclease/exonuclease/phosphatase family protein [Sphingopyxis]QUM73189.1 endonuclease/exonuclease/phosphatase family protein [Sphingopyxis granuli]
MASSPAYAVGRCPAGQEAAIQPVRIGAFNVMFGERGTPEEVARLLSPYHLDLVAFAEVPDGDWTERAGKVLGLPYAYVGKISSANHKDKYKSILSSAPLSDIGETRLDSGTGWKPASAVHAVTTIGGLTLRFYALHVAASRGRSGQLYEFLRKEALSPNDETMVVAGDFNNEIGDSAISNLRRFGFKSVWSGAGVNPQRQSTVVAPSRIGIIDHIFYRSSAKVTVPAAAVVEAGPPLSDHRPTVAELRFETCRSE